MEDGSFLRLKNVKLTYNIDKKLLRRLPVNSLQAYIYGNDLCTWTNYTGYDPEIGGNVLNPGLDGANYPRKREYGLGLTLGFLCFTFNIKRNEKELYLLTFYYFRFIPIHKVQ